MHHACWQDFETKKQTQILAIEQYPVEDSAITQSLQLVM
jgi:hypothetical protein